jgi:hypothetical protein
MNLAEVIISSIPQLIFCLIFILKPRWVANLLGYIYWQMGKFTALGKSEDTKKYFFSERTYWFRLLGYIVLILWIVSVYINISNLDRIGS